MGKKLSKKRSHENDEYADHIEPMITRPPISCVAKLNNHILLASKQDGILRIVNKDTLREEQSLNVHEREITKVEVESNNEYIYTASRDKTICRTNIKNTSDIVSYKSHNLVVTALSLNNDSSRFVSGSRDCSVKLWDVETCQEIRSETTPRCLVNDLKWMTDRHLIVKCSEDKVVKLVDEKSLRDIHSFPMKQYFQTCCDVEGDTLVVGSTGGNEHGCEVHAYDLRNNQLISTMKSHTQKVNACKFIPSSRNKLLSLSDDSSMVMWDDNTGDEIVKLYIDGARQLTSIAFDNSNLAYVGTFQRGCCIIEIKDNTLTFSKDF